MENLITISPEMFCKLKTILEEGNGGFLRYGIVNIYNTEKSFHVTIEGEYEEIQGFINGESKKVFNFEDGEYRDAEFMEMLKFIQHNIKPFIDTKFIIEGLCDGNIDVKEWSRVVLKETFMKFFVDYCKIPSTNILHFT